MIPRKPLPPLPSAVSPVVRSISSDDSALTPRLEAFPQPPRESLVTAWLKTTTTTSNSSSSSRDTKYGASTETKVDSSLKSSGSRKKDFSLYEAYMLGATTAQIQLEQWHAATKSWYRVGSDTSSEEEALKIIEKEDEDPYSIFSQKEKIFIIIVASCSTLLPPMAGNILYPVIEIIASDLKVSVNQVNLTITAYLLVQGLAPSFIGNLSDSHGRRPALLVAFSIFILGSLGAAFPGSYTILVVTRCLQAAGSSGTIAIASAMVTDIVTTAQRGSYYSYVQLGAMVGPSLGPIIGGLLTNTWGWRSIFWFLTSFSSLIFLVILFFLPETSRNIVNNGSVSSQVWNRPLLRHNRGSPVRPQKARFNPLESFTLFYDRENFILLVYAGVVWSTQYYFFTTLSSEFREHFHFSTISISLVFLATGCGTVIAVLLAGRLQDYNFRRHAQRLGIKISHDKQQSLADFPIEVARLQTSFPLIFLAFASLIIYGWLLQKGYPDGPIILAFLWAAGYAAAFNCISNLLVDLNRDQPGTVTASLNLARNWIGACVVASANPLTTTLGSGWANSIVAGALAILFPALLLVYYKGHSWRKEAASIEERKAACTCHLEQRPVPALS